VAPAVVYPTQLLEIILAKQPRRKPGLSHRGFMANNTISAILTLVVMLAIVLSLVKISFSAALRDDDEDREESDPNVIIFSLPVPVPKWVRRHFSKK
jgi:hypothetical protein